MLRRRVDQLGERTVGAQYVEPQVGGLPGDPQIEWLGAADEKDRLLRPAEHGGDRGRQQLAPLDDRRPSRGQPGEVLEDKPKTVA